MAAPSDTTKAPDAALRLHGAAPGKDGREPARGGLSARHYLDRAFTGLIRIGGGFTVVCVLAIFVYMGLQVLPLFQSPKVKEPRVHGLEPPPRTIYPAAAGEAAPEPPNGEIPGAAIPATGKPLAAKAALPPPMAFAMDENQSALAALWPSGGLSVNPLASRREASPRKYPVRAEPGVFRIPLDSGETLASAFVQFSSCLFAYGTGTGRVGLVKVRFRREYAEDVTRVLPETAATSPISLLSTADSAGIRPRPEILSLAASETGDGGPRLFAGLRTPGGPSRAVLLRFDEELEALVDSLPLAEVGHVKQAAFNFSGDLLLAADNQDWLHLYGLEDGEASLRDKWKHRGEVLGLSPVFGDQAFAVISLNQGRLRLEALLPVSQPQGVRRYAAVHSWSPEGEAHSGTPRFQLLPYPTARNIFFLSPAEGEARLDVYETTTGRRRFTGRLHGRYGPAALDPKGQRLMALADEQGPPSLRVWEVDDPHPDFTVSALFRPVQYEGYPEPDLVWQSSAGNDEFQHKLSLVPLIFGTFKGTLFAMLFSVPLAVGAAVYISHFAPRRLKNAVKPAIELTGSIPSVVIGFIAGIVLAPWLKDHLLWFFLFFALSPAVLFLLGVALSRGDENRSRGMWKALARWLNDPVPSTLIFFGAFVLLFLACFPLETALEGAFFRGSFADHLSEELGFRFDMRNGVLIGMALGFAVIPIIFTLAEDALSNVPPSLISAARALGASKWQTIMRVVLIAASPGIFVAVIIGLGRAVGETMIVLMASGNTPVLDLSLFTGLRSMSATIAIEIPEAPHGETLYRVLFLVGFLLFCFTFVLNLIADIYSHHLKKKFGQLTG